jgi:hypothetical protein
MEWKSWTWVEDAASVESPGEPVEGTVAEERLLAEELHGRLPELWLVACAYEYMAAGAQCSKCGSPLGHDTQMVIGPDGGAPGALMVTRCRGRRRHQHLARVRERSGDLVFGRFEQRPGWRRLRTNLHDAGTVVDSKWTGHPGDVA